VLLPEMMQFVQTLRQREAEIVMISDDADAQALGRASIPLPAGVPEWLSPLTAIVPCQLFAMHLAVVRDFDPDHPRGLRKVTETK
jgi:glucosamine--fructose-6-phosphate aminotransferase (isomerizing)